VPYRAGHPNISYRYDEGIGEAMSKVYLADGQVLMCDKCEGNPAQYYVTGLSSLSYYDGLCAQCCADYLRARGDIEGAKKFEEVGA
jgi:hypothetical protein